MNKKLEFQTDVLGEIEVEVTCSVTEPRSASRGGGGLGGPSPAEPAEVEDLYVGLIVCGSSINVTKLLNRKALEWIKDECLKQAQESEEYAG